jgi:hypothetical protein
MLLGSTGAKAARRTLMKLTPGGVATNVGWIAKFGKILKNELLGRKRIYKKLEGLAKSNEL